MTPNYEEILLQITEKSDILPALKAVYELGVDHGRKAAETEWWTSYDSFVCMMQDGAKNG